MVDLSGSCDEPSIGDPPAHLLQVSILVPGMLRGHPGAAPKLRHAAGPLLGTLRNTTTCETEECPCQGSW